MTPTQHTFLVQIDLPVLLEANARLHSDRNIDDIMQSLTEHGQVTPIVINEKKEVQKGNGTLMAARKLGWTKILVTPYAKAYNGPGQETDVRLKKYQIIDNQSGLTSEWDLPQLQKDFQWLIEQGVAFNEVGFQDHEATPILDAEFDVGDIEELKDQEVPDLNFGEPVQVTEEQRIIFDKACLKLREQTDQEYSEGKCLELLCAEYLSA